MRFVFRRKLAGFLAIGMLSAAALQRVSAQSKEQCALSGAVVNSATNAGIPHALVSFGGATSGFRFTDAGGNFRVDGAACGPYTLQVSKPGFVSAQKLSDRSADLLVNPVLAAALEAQNQDSAGKAPTPSFQQVELKPDSPPARVQLVPVASIAGSVLDENGEPLAGVVVQAISLKQSLDGVEYTPARNATTDDRGHYALLNLTPGEYIARLVGEASSTHYFAGNRLVLNNDHRGAPPIYYANADTASAATVLRLNPGEQSAADFHQTTEAAFDINGSLANFVPNAWTRVELYRDGDRLPLGVVFVNLVSGVFRAVDIPPGRYTLRAVQYQADPPKWLAAETAVTVAAEPIRDLVVELSGGVDIPVTVSYEAGATADALIQLLLRPLHTQRNVRQASIGKMRRREFTGGEGLLAPGRLQTPNPQPDADPPQPSVITNVIPDQYKLTIQLLGNVKEYVASAKLGDSDILNRQFSIGAAASELHVTMRGDSATVQGTVTSGGQPALGARVYLFPSANASAGLKQGFAGEDGKFQIQGIPPGEYRVQAWTGTPQLKDISSASSQTVTLEPNENRTLSLETKSAGDSSSQ